MKNKNPRRAAASAAAVALFSLAAAWPAHSPHSFAAHPTSLIRQGWSRDSLEADDVINVEGSLARDGSRLASAQSIVLAATGKRVLSPPIPSETSNASR